MKNFKRLFLAVFLVLSIGIISYSVKAEEQITFSPTQIVVKENELGKKYTITINNASQNDYIFTVDEKLVKKTEDKLEISDTEVTLKRLEIPIKEFKVKANTQFELTVRVKIFTNESFEYLPSLLIKEKNDPKNELKILFQTVIPFIIQNTKGESKIENNLSINAQNYTIDPKLSIIGSVENMGSKFSNISGTILILKNGKIIDEKEITSQISGLFFPKEIRNYNIEWNNTFDFFDGLGEYSIESRVNNDETSNTSVTKISFIYIPKNLIIASICSIAGIAIIISTIRFYKKSKRK